MNSPEIGQGATIRWHTDRTACTVIAILSGGKTILLREDTARLLNGPTSGEPDSLKVTPGGFAAHWSGKQRWATEPNPEGRTYKATKRKDGTYRLAGSQELVVLGVREPYYDFNF